MENNGSKLALSVALEAVLFKLNEPTELKKLCTVLKESEEGVLSALNELRESLAGRGISLLQNENEYSLVTAKNTSPVIEKMIKGELREDIGKAGLETISIILYKWPISRREIDYIRGVNSTFILRSLMIRGLISREEGSPPLYKPTSELLSFLGVSKMDDLPNFQEVRAEMTKKEENNKDGND